MNRSRFVDFEIPDCSHGQISRSETIGRSSAADLLRHVFFSGSSDEVGKFRIIAYQNLSSLIEK